MQVVAMMPLVDLIRPVKAVAMLLIRIEKCLCLRSPSLSKKRDERSLACRYMYVSVSMVGR